MRLIGTSADPAETGSQFSITHPYAKGKAINNGVTTIAAAGNIAADLVTTGYQWLFVLARLGNATTPATAAGDISYSVCAYEDDGTTLFPSSQVAGINADFAARVATLTSSFAWKADRYNLGGIDKVRIVLVNNNVAPLQGGTVIYYLQK